MSTTFEIFNQFFKGVHSYLDFPSVFRVEHMIGSPEGRLSPYEACLSSFEFLLQRPFEPRYEKTGLLHMRKQRRRSATQ